MIYLNKYILQLRVIEILFFDRQRCMKKK